MKYDEILKDQMKWLAQSVFEKGEFVMNSSPQNNYYKIVPYFSNIAAISLLHEQKYFNKVKQYISWYISHLNIPDKYGVTGTIYDYNLRANGELVSTNDYDSYDSYPATFFTLCKEYYNKTKNSLFFIRNKQKFHMIINSLIESMDEDYLTWAKPNYKIKYLMDNCEVYRGLVDAANIYEIVFDNVQMARKLNVLALRNFDNIENKMYNSNHNYYYYQINKHGKQYSPNYKKWYPDATSQLFPILYELITSNSIKAKRIYKKFNKYQPNWFNENSNGDFPNTYVGYIATLLGDYERVSKFIDYCIKKYINNKNKWPWNCFECGYFIRMVINYRKMKQM